MQRNTLGLHKIYARCTPVENVGLLKLEVIRDLKRQSRMVLRPGEYKELNTAAIFQW